MRENCLHQKVSHLQTRIEASQTRIADLQSNFNVLLNEKGYPHWRNTFVRQRNCHLRRRISFVQQKKENLQTRICRLQLNVEHLRLRLSRLQSRIDVSH